jgi:serine/threonine protein kinase
MGNTSEQQHASPQGPWEETIRQGPPGTFTPLKSVTVARARPCPDMARRASGYARARAAHAGAPAADLADYVLGELLGAGGMGRVYAATQIALDRTVAVKVLHPQLHADDAVREEFLAEALVASDLDHPNTVPIYDLGITSEGNLFYSMKLVRGSRWGSIMAGYPLEANLEMLLKVCDVVSFAHDKGIVHRDIKPDNVMVGSYGEVMLMDWGLAASVGSPRAQPLTDSNLVAGTPAFLPPEVASCDIGLIGKASDIYLLGGILYQIVTGLTPHGGTSLEGCLEAARRNELQPAEAAGELLTVALRALDTGPANRYPSAREFAAAVRDFMAHQISLDLSNQAHQRFEALPDLVPEEFYRECEEIISLLQRALGHWPGNTRAAQRLVWLRDTMAAVALRRGEIQLARSSARAAERERQFYGIDSLPPDAVAERVKTTLTDRYRRGWSHPPEA